jgi:hypothetical protein
MAVLWSGWFGAGGDTVCDAVTALANEEVELGSSDEGTIVALSIEDVVVELVGGVVLAELVDDDVVLALLSGLM